MNYNIISYGGGTQSTAMILMILNEDIKAEKPDFGVYADTGAEPQFINEYVDYFIDYVKNKYNFDIYKIQNKQGLENHLLQTEKISRQGNFYTSSVPPLFTKNINTGEKGMLMRQCTGDYKTNPVKKFINSKIGRKDTYTMYLGISFDERERMKISQYKKRKNVYPLVDNFIRRKESIDYVLSQGLRKPLRSSCYFCPFHSNNYWQWLKDYHPTEFERACNLEAFIQKNIHTENMIYLHRSCKDLNEVNFTDKDQLSLFPELIEECDGECGI